ncbi:MAG TPA: amidohydrolase family protein [Woeseiaceae bacterium]|nr:amidohydrolase family protein [Woeseiaceae bacterium]
MTRARIDLTRCGVKPVCESPARQHNIDWHRMRKIAGFLTILVCASACDRPAPGFLPDFGQIDLLIENGQVVDGTGSLPRLADIVVVGDEIVFVGNSDFSAADLRQRVIRRIDATGRVVTPGFIDLHAHGDPLETPYFENFLAMGVTTITLGQDGSSAEVEQLANWLQQVSKNGIGPNMLTFVGHGSLRELSGVRRTVEPDAQHLQGMRAMLANALDVSFGLSTGLEYEPGLYAQEDELKILAELVGQKGRIIMSHMRSEDDDQLDTSIQELLAQGHYAPVHVSHLKSVHGKGKERAEEILALLSAARASGIKVTADVYPYMASYTGIGLLFPVWAKSDEQFRQAVTGRHGELREYLRNKVEQRGAPEATLLGTAPYTGKTLAEVALQMEMPFEDVLIDIIGPSGADAAYFVMDDQLQSRLLADPYVSVSSDGSPTTFHPRAYGTFARIIERYVEKEKMLTLPEAIRKMTSLAASILGITDRGVIAPGMKADLLVFKPEQVHETASFADPMQLAVGFDLVIVNGKLARENGKMDGALHGRVLLPST